MNISWKQEIIYRRNIPRTPENDLDWDIGVLSSSDIKKYKSSHRYSEVDIQRLQEADYCVVARENSVPVHHTCLAVGPGFDHPRKQLSINISDDEGYIYNVKTETEYRGKGIAPAVFKYIDRLSSNKGIKRVYADVESENKASRRAFKKSDYSECGVIRQIQADSKAVIVVQGINFYQGLYKLPLLNIYITRYQSTRQKRIQEEIEEFAKVWNDKNQSVVLFGAGNHAEELLEIQAVRSAVSYIVDESDKKVGTVLSDGQTTVREITAVEQDPPDIIVICSRAFQQEMVARISQYIDSAQVLTLYPEVGYE